jgi:hypothetical protein
MRPGKQRKPRKERVKAWIYSVINPILDGLAIEAGFLEKGNWTFRRYNRDLEFIRPIPNFVTYQSRPNWDDFTLSNPAAMEKIDRRDDQRKELRDACRAAFDSLVAKPDFVEKVDECFRVFEVEAPGETSRLTHPAVKPHEVIAELVVNNRAGVPDHTGIYPFWSRFREELMRFRAGVEFDNADQAGLELRKRSEDLSLELSKTRSDLAAEYDVPWAPYPDGAAVLPSR